MKAAAFSGRDAFFSTTSYGALIHIRSALLFNADAGAQGEWSLLS